MKESNKQTNKKERVTKRRTLVDTFKGNKSSENEDEGQEKSKD